MSKIYIDQYVEVAVDVDEVIRNMSDDEAREVARKAGAVPGALGFGQGDQARIRNIIDSAERALRAMPAVPPELKDLFWHVHGRAI